MGKYSVANDPKGLIFEAYRMDGISSEDCRSIFFDWVLGLKPELNAIDELTTLYNLYVKNNPSHPMSQVIEEGLSNFNRKRIRRGGRQNRV